MLSQGIKPLTAFGAPLSSAFRSLSPTILGSKNQRQAVPKQPNNDPSLSELNPNMEDELYGKDKELAMLAKYFNPMGGR